MCMNRFMSCLTVTAVSTPKFAHDGAVREIYRSPGFNGPILRSISEDGTCVFHTCSSVCGRRIL